MKILIVNDDGIESKPLRELALGMQKYGHQVYVVAPHEEQSGASHAISLKRGLRIIQNYNWNGIQAIGVTCTPADCVKIGFDVVALRENIKFDLILSGLNNVPNFGTDIIYSGTVSGAREAAVYGYAGIALSAVSDCADYSYPVQFVGENIQLLKSMAEKFPISINFPSCNPNKIKGVKIANQGVCRYTDRYVEKVENGETVFYLQGELMDLPNEENSDVKLLQKGYITLTALSLDCTDFSGNASLDKIKEDLWLA